MTRPDLMALLGRRVTVTNPNAGRAWTGKLVAVADDPSVVIDQDRGPRMTLPQFFTITPADDAPPETATRPSPVDHGRRIHAVIFNAVTEETRRLDRFLSLTDRDKVTAAVVAALAAHGYGITYAGGAE